MKSGIVRFVFVGIAMIVGWYVFSQFVNVSSRSEMKNVENQVADDAVKQYRIAEKDGTMIDVCVQAGLVSAAYLQAQDEENYHKWKAIEKKDCAAAGVSQ